MSAIFMKLDDDYCCGDRSDITGPSSGPILFGLIILVRRGAYGKYVQNNLARMCFLGHGDSQFLVAAPCEKCHFLSQNTL